MAALYSKNHPQDAHLEVHDTSALPGHLRLQVSQAGRLCNATVDKRDAAAVALSILEAAGWNDGYDEHDPDDPKESTILALREVVQDRQDELDRKASARAAQEAEDVEVAKYAEHRLTSQGVKAPYPWADMSEVHRNHWRVEYRSNKAFFTTPPPVNPWVLPPNND